MKNVLVFILSFLFIFAVKGGTTSCDFTSVEAKIDGLLQTYPEIPGAGLVIGYEDEVFYEKYWKIYTENTIVPLASATKLLSGVTIMGLVDVGLIDLDAPVNGYLPEFTGDKAQMTVRQMFSHTAGMPINRLLENTYILNAYNGLTLAQAVSVLACCEPLMYEPNTAFAYGGASMHIAGRVAEVVSNKSWPDVFSQYLTTPLGINSMDFNGLGVTLNYRPAGGAKSSLPDYAKVLNMLLNKGRYHTTRLLSEQAVEEMLIDNVLDKQIIFPPEDSGIISRYGIGMWLRLNYLDGSLTGIHSAGARGFTPWIDYDLDYYAAFMVDDDNTRIKATMAEVREEIRQILSNNWCGTQPKPVTKELGLWYDPQHNGHGFEIQKIGNNHAGVFYTFTQQGEPIWYLMDVKNQQDGISGDLLYVKNTGTSNALQIDSHSVGNFVINFNP
ncbi:MAG TPA: class A beta-lactamase-related serine hydrolase, partial [Oceanospirillales bacterium]|nr:class A beta-lactamase-related serine hydrolase [Oceanospirillales bacterium]